MAIYKYPAVELGWGAKGTEVSDLQEKLNQNGYKLDVDGSFGNQTKAAVEDYQKKNGLTVDGIVGQNTWNALTGGSTTNQTTATTPAADTGFKYDAYQESDAVKQAQAMLDQQLSQKPGAYQSAWQTQLNDTINKILNREKFSYDLNGDALYQQYKDQYTTQGKMAMMDTMGQAQAMTGGYGNSYAQSVGQQAYQGYLQQLNDKVPELYQLALNKYQMEGEDLATQYSILGAQEQQDYGRYRDQVSDYNTELDRLQNRYDTERNFDYGKWADNRDFGYGQYIDDRNYQYQQERDKVSDEQWQKEFEESLRRYNYEHKLGEFAVQKTTTKKTPTSPTGPTEPTGDDKLTYSDVALTAAQMRKQGASPNDIYQYISSVVNGPNYTPTNNAKQDLAELKSGYVGNGR